MAAQRRAAHVWPRRVGFCTSAEASRVSTSPGAIALTRTFELPSSKASVLVIEMTAAFVMP